VRPRSLAGHFFAGRAYLALDDLPRAVRHLRHAIEVGPRFAPGLGLLGIALLRARRPERAIWMFAKALEIDPRNEKLQAGYLNTALVLAVRLFKSGDLVDAARLFSEVLGQRPGSILPHLYLARIWRELGRPATALSHMDAALAIAPDDPFLRIQRGLLQSSSGDTSGAAASLAAGARLLEEPTAPAGTPTDIQRYLAVNLYKAGRWREAAYHATQLLKQAYGDPPLHALVAACWQKLGDTLRARNHYRRAIERDRATMAIRYGLLEVLWERGEHAELLQEADRILQRSAGDATAAYFRSLALPGTGEAVEQALGELQAQVRLRGPDPALMAALGRAYARAGLPALAEGWLLRARRAGGPRAEDLVLYADVSEALHKPARVADALREYLSLRPADRPARKRLVRVLLERGAWEDAARHITRLMAMEPGNLRLTAALSVCRRRAGRYADALLLLRELLAEKPGSEEHMKAAVYCLDRLGARQSAARGLEGFLRAHGERASLLNMLGVLHVKDGALEKATAAFRRALSVAPGDWRANRNLGLVYRRMGSEEFAARFLARAEAARPPSEPLPRAGTSRARPKAKATGKEPSRRPQRRDRPRS
jgi:tetratricopeptide (TPR) repeat protein